MRPTSGSKVPGTAAVAEIASTVRERWQEDTLMPLLLCAAGTVSWFVLLGVMFIGGGLSLEGQCMPGPAACRHANTLFDVWFYGFGTASLVAVVLGWVFLRLRIIALALVLLCGGSWILFGLF